MLSAPVWRVAPPDDGPPTVSKLPTSYSPLSYTPISFADAVPPAVSCEGVAAQVQALLDSCDRATTTGMRDYAMLLLLATYGLRGIEVAASLLIIAFGALLLMGYMSSERMIGV